MGLDNSFFKKKNLRDIKRRISNRGKPKDIFLIICEGKRTEPHYFESFKLSSEIIKIEGIGQNTLTLVQETVRARERARKYDTEYDQIWCVFDKDSFPDDIFNKAIELANREKINVAYSNEAFELWYLLHFNYVNTGISRAVYFKKLDKLLRKKYRKDSTEMYELLLDKQEVAIKNAERLLSQYDPPNPSRNNPSTTVHNLVKELNKFIS